MSVRGEGHGLDMGRLVTQAAASLPWALSSALLPCTVHEGYRQAFPRAGADASGGMLSQRVYLKKKKCKRDEAVGRVASSML